MAALKNIAFMGASTVIRLCFGMLTFVLLARLLGPNSFGVLMLWLSIATLMAMVANFGFAPYLLREIGAKPSSAQQIMESTLSAKLLLSAFALVVSLFGAAFLEMQLFIVFFLLLCAQLVESMTEFLNVGFRATNRFNEETRIATITSIMQFLIVTTIVLLEPSLQAAALAYFISRALVLLLTWFAQRQYFSKFKPSNLKCALQTIRQTVAFAVDFSLQTLFGQVDSLIINHFIGQFAVGIYQAGMKIFMSGAQAANILSNVLIPNVASSVADETTHKLKNNKMVTSFAILGLCGYLLFISTPIKLINLALGSNFEPVLTILYPLGVLFLIRFSAAGLGLVLTIQGMQRSRSVCTLLHWVVVTLCVAIFGVADLIDWIRWLIVGNFFLAVSYLAISIHTGFRTTIYCSLTLGTAFLITVSWLI